MIIIKSNKLFLLLGCLSVCIFFISITKPVFASEQIVMNHEYIYEDDSENNLIASTEVTESIYNFPSLTQRMGVMLQADIWMVVASKNGGVPQLDKYWHVAYSGGKKYQGYVYWTGDKRIKSWGPPPQMEFRFKGTLN